MGKKMNNSVLQFHWGRAGDRGDWMWVNKREREGQLRKRI